MKCPHCQMDDVLIGKTRRLQLLSFVFVTVTCVRCDKVFMLPDVELSGEKKDEKRSALHLGSRHAA